MLPVVGYPRVSSEEQAKHGVSMDSQRKKIRLYCELKELELVKMIEDEGVSAKTLNRPGMLELIELMRSGEIGGVVITKLDRLTRSLADWSFLIGEFFGEKGSIRLFSDGDDINTTTATGRMTLNIIMTIAQWEREIISERTKEKMGSAIADGIRCGKIPYGYDLDPESPKNRRGNPSRLIPNLAEQKVIHMLRTAAADGNSFRVMAKMLEELGIESKEGNDIWTPATIRKILHRGVAA